VRFQDEEAGQKGKTKEARGMRSVHFRTYSESKKHQSPILFMVFIIWWMWMNGIHFHKMAARTSSSLKTIIALQLTT
jgi:hypothetical protein